MEVPSTSTTFTRWYRWVAIGLSILILSGAFLFGLGLKRQPTEYQAQADLSYAGNVRNGIRKPPLSAIEAASLILDNMNLRAIMDQLSLYPKLRSATVPHWTADTIAMMRSRINLSQTSPGALQLSFRDEDSVTSLTTVNALADLLQRYTVNTSGRLILLSPNPSVNTGLSAPPPVTVPRPVPKPVVLPPQPVAMVKVSAPKRTSDDQNKLKQKIARIDDRLADYETEQQAIQAESKANQNKIDSLQRSGMLESSAPSPRPQLVDPAADSRAMLKIQLAKEREALAGLLQRYTEAYPDVQSTEQSIRETQAKLAALPPPVMVQPKVQRQPDLYQNQLNELTAEESRLGTRLRGIESEIATLEKNRKDLEIQLLSVPETPPIAAPLPLPVLPPPVPATVVPPTVQPASPPSVQPIANQPFHILTRATGTVELTGLNKKTLIQIVSGTFLSLLVCYAPLMLKRRELDPDLEEMQDSLL